MHIAPWHGSCLEVVVITTNIQATCTIIMMLPSLHVKVLASCSVGMVSSNVVIWRGRLPAIPVIIHVLLLLVVLLLFVPPWRLVLPIAARTCVIISTSTKASPAVSTRTTERTLCLLPLLLRLLLPLPLLLALALVCSGIILRVAAVLNLVIPIRCSLALHTFSCCELLLLQQQPGRLALLCLRVLLWL